MDIEDLKEQVIEHLESLGFYGTDASLKESLFEYGLICRELKDGSFCFLYAVGENVYCNGSFNTQEIDNFLYESWFDLDSFLDFTSMHLNSFLQLPAINKMYDYLAYYGYQYIFGIAYYQITLKELVNQTL